MRAFIPGIHLVQHGIALVNRKDRTLSKDIQFGIGNNRCNLDNTVIVRVEAGHLHVDPDEVHFIRTDGARGGRMRFNSL